MSTRCSNCGWQNELDRENCEQCNAPLTKDVFISYSRKDYVDDAGNVLPNNMLSKIKDNLKANGVSYWFDEEGIYSGDEFASVITRAIRTSKIFLFISSANSNQSPWTSNEISTALEYKKTIIPLRLDKSPYNDSVMMKIVSLDRIDCDNHEIAITKLLRAIRHNIPETKRNGSKISENPQSAEGATVVMDNGDKIVEHIITIGEKAIKEEKKVHNGIFNNDRRLNLLEYKVFRDDFFVHIADKNTPIVMLMGPTAVGKTMTLVRLVRYLHELGFTVQPDRFFRSDIDYDRLYVRFQELVNGKYAADRTDRWNCMLIKIMDGIGRSVLQIVDVAGGFYDDESDSTPLPPFLLQILQSSNPFIWVVMVEPYWKDPYHRMELVERIRRFKQLYFRAEDKVILLYNKTDKLPFFQGKNNMAFDPFFNLIRQEYPGIVEVFENPNPITKLFRKYNCSIAPFSTGTYTQSHNGRMIYVPSSPAFPHMLWKELTK